MLYNHIKSLSPTTSCEPSILFFFLSFKCFSFFFFLINIFVQVKLVNTKKVARPLAFNSDHHISSDEATNIASPLRPDHHTSSDDATNIGSPEMVSHIFYFFIYVLSCTQIVSLLIFTHLLSFFFSGQWLRWRLWSNLNPEKGKLTFSKGFLYIFCHLMVFVLPWLR